MKTVTVNASTKYDVLIGAGILPELSKRLKDVTRAKKLCIVSDSNVWPIYGLILEDALKAEGFEIYSFVFPAGEESKCGDTYLQLVNALAEFRLTRSDCLIALGGGVVGDLTGFAAATYLRGMDFVQVPTTLLAAVDSSVGGKTAIDLPAGKNLCGAFYQPKLVLCDTDVLNTLPEDIFRDGCAEVIKYGILYDRKLFDHLMEFGIHFNREDTIARCVELKRDVVIQDEFDRGARQQLNLGHTIGHAVEKLSHFQLSHGKSVSIGMAIVTRAAEKLGLSDRSVCSQIIEILHRFSLPTDTQHASAALYDAALSDKKRSGDTVNLIVPQQIGTCRICPTPVHQLLSFIEAGL